MFSFQKWGLSATTVLFILGTLPSLVRRGLRPPHPLPMWGLRPHTPVNDGDEGWGVDGGPKGAREWMFMVGPSPLPLVWAARHAREGTHK